VIGISKVREMCKSERVSKGTEKKALGGAPLGEQQKGREKGKHRISRFQGESQARLKVLGKTPVFRREVC